MVKSGLIVAIVLLGGIATVIFARHSTDQVQQDIKLTAVRIFASDGDLDVIESEAASIGWVDHKRDRSGTTLLSVPKNYQPHNFGELLSAIERSHVKANGVRMIASDGRAVDGDGNLYPDN
jgi:hypothetical protein